MATKCNFDCDDLLQRGELAHRVNGKRADALIDTLTDTLTEHGKSRTSGGWYAHCEGEGADSEISLLSSS